MTNLSNITLVIPAYNRPAYLERQIDFWSQTDVKLCILDGSRESAPQALIDRMGLNVYYRHLPIGFNERLVMACDLVQTKYVALLGDDELYAPHGLCDCISQLESDKRLVACVGRSMFFFHREGEIIGHQTYEKSQNLVNTFGSDIDRLHESLVDITRGPYLLYGLFNTHQWKTAVRVSYGRKYASGYVYEFAFHLIATLLGPSVMVNSLVWIRSGENPAMSSDAVNRKIGIGEWGTDPQFSEEVNYLIDGVVEAVANEGRFAAKEIRNAVCRGVEGFVAYSLHKPKRPIAYWHRTLYFLARKTPTVLKQLLKRNMSTGLSKVLDYRGMPMSQAINEMKKNGIALNENEMQLMEKFLIHFHQQLATS
jgi:glycosyltransferase domain-containing protein